MLERSLPEVVTDALACGLPASPDVGFFPYPFVSPRAPFGSVTVTHYPIRECVQCGEPSLVFSDLCHACHMAETLTPEELAEARGAR